MTNEEIREAINRKLGGWTPYEEKAEAWDEAATAAMEVVGPVLDDLEVRIAGAQADILERGKQIERLKWLRAEAAWLAENRLDVGDRLAWRLVEAEQEIVRLRREVEFEAHGADNFSGADALAEQGGPQCSVHPNGDSR